MINEPVTPAEFPLSPKRLLRAATTSRDVHSLGPDFVPTIVPLPSIKNVVGKPQTR